MIFARSLLINTQECQQRQKANTSLESPGRQCRKTKRMYATSSTSLHVKTRSCSISPLSETVSQQFTQSVWPGASMMRHHLMDLGDNAPQKAVQIVQIVNLTTWSLLEFSESSFSVGYIVSYIVSSTSCSILHWILHWIPATETAAAEKHELH